MNLLQSLTRGLFIPSPEWVSFNGVSYPLYGLNQTLSGGKEEMPQDFTSVIAYLYQANAVVHACEDVRIKLFSEARFQFRQMRNGRPGDLFGTPALGPLERPWPGGTTGDLLAGAMQHADFSGNSFIVRRPNRLRLPRPDWMTIILGSEREPEAVAGDLDAEVIGYLYHPGGHYSGRKPVPLLPEEVAHFAPIPDPLACYRGMSWITPVIREVMADTAATQHKLRFFEQGATPNLVVSLDPAISKQAFEDWVKTFEGRYGGGLRDAYKTMFMGAGAKVQVVGADLKQIDFKITQGAGETRIAAAAGVPPVIVGLSEGLQAATYSNYGQARRRFADGTMRPLWRNMAGSLARIISAPAGSVLWYDDRDIPFLAEDRKDAAEIQSVNAQAIRALVDAGFDADTVVNAITSGDLSRLSHTGLFSVQLQPPQPEQPEPIPSQLEPGAKEPPLLPAKAGRAKLLAPLLKEG